MNGIAKLKYLATTAVSVGALCAGALRAEAAYVQTNLVSDLPGVAAVTDTELVNPWGLSFIGGASPFWISNQGTDTTTLYAVNGATNVSEFDVNPPPPAIPTSNVVAIPPGIGPTGQVSNGPPSTSFQLSGSPARFIFADLSGNISAWNGGLSATMVQSTRGVAYTALAINSAQTELFAASAGGINVFDSSFAPIGTMFTTPASIAAAGLVPFDVRDISGNVFVTYAPDGHGAQTGATLGQGAVAEFSESGTLESISTPMADSHLAAPWGIAIAPASFGAFGGDILVGNFSFGASEINAFDPTNWNFMGTIPVDVGSQMPGGLWSLSFGGGGLDGSPNVLYFTDGINSEGDGLFGAIASVPEPSTWAMMLIGLGGLGLTARRRRRVPLAIV
jgi:uncharacterized protein (TIGR03118 family)